MPSKAKILLVEDVRLNQVLVVSLLAPAGYEVDVAGDGREAVDRLTAAGPDAYDAVLMDLQMPVLDGLQATAEIRQLSAFDRLPIIAMTAHSSSAERMKCSAAGMNGHVVKPINADDLMATLSSLVGKSD